MKPPHESGEGPVIGCVVIGGNEGERLGDSLRSALSHTRRVIYGGSGSTDGSRDIAETLDVMIVVLDTGTPMTAARGRNVARIAARSGLDSRRSWQSALLAILSKFTEAIGSTSNFASGSAHRAYDYKPMSKTGKLETS